MHLSFASKNSIPLRGLLAFVVNVHKSPSNRRWKAPQDEFTMQGFSQSKAHLPPSFNYYIKMMWRQDIFCYQEVVAVRYKIYATLDDKSFCLPYNMRIPLFRNYKINHVVSKNAFELQMAIQARYAVNELNVAWTTLLHLPR